MYSFIFSSRELKSVNTAEKSWAGSESLLPTSLNSVQQVPTDSKPIFLEALQTPE